MKRLVLVRHGESRWNAEQRVQGQACAGLSERGHAQAKSLADELARRFAGMRLVSSDLLRARQTAETVAGIAGVDVAEDPAVRERSFGRWEGRLLDDIAADEPNLWDRWRGGEDVIAEIGGESAAQLAARVVPALERHAAETPDGEATVVIAHGGTIWHGVHGLLGLVQPTLGGVRNTSLTIIGLDDGLRWLDTWNSDGHLPTDLRRSARRLRGTTGRSAPPAVGH
ncbi:MAG: histidine phosphatase family protein [Nitriliruptoraceae bacterium]